MLRCRGVGREARDKWLIMELRQEPWTFSTAYLSLLSAQDCLCKWVTSCYLGALSFTVKCCHLTRARGLSRFPFL